MMKRYWSWVGLIALVVCLSMTSLTGCAKKSGLTSGSPTTQDQKAGGAAGVSSTDDQATARAKELREQTAREAAAKGMGTDAAEQAKRDAAASRQRRTIRPGTCREPEQS